jgi:hypothetical protein
MTDIYLEYDDVHSDSVVKDAFDIPNVSTIAFRAEDKLHDIVVKAKIWTDGSLMWDTTWVSEQIQRFCENIINHSSSANMDGEWLSMTLTCNTDTKFAIMEHLCRWDQQHQPTEP